jgi:Protein of unknown function (DUF2985)
MGVRFSFFEGVATLILYPSDICRNIWLPRRYIEGLLISNNWSDLLLVFWGAAIVIFLAKIINLHNANTQGFWIEVSSQIENGEFPNLHVIYFKLNISERSVHRNWYWSYPLSRAGYI